QGRTVDFRNAVIIMTSNIGSQYLMESGPEEEIRDKVLNALRVHFRPEFLNRVDETVLFHRLGKEQLREILDIQLNNVRGLLGRRNVTMALTDAAAGLLIDEGYDPFYGARPLKRVLQKQVIDPLALKLLEGDIRDDDHVVIDAADGALTFNIVEIAEPVM
ncbi:MAG: AAA family ATPase, partial [Candidatus Promineifilaceae bacterium]